MHYEKRIKQSKETTDWLKSQGIHPTITENARKLWNIGNDSGPGYVSYAQAKDL